MMEELLHRKRYWLPASKFDEQAASKANFAEKELASVF
jgi:hypothetical protein